MLPVLELSNFSGAALKWGRTEGSGFVIEDGLYVVVLFIGPTIDVGQLNLPILLDEDVLVLLVVSRAYCSVRVSVEDGLGF